MLEVLSDSDVELPVVELEEERVLVRVLVLVEEVSSDELSSVVLLRSEVVVEDGGPVDLSLVELASEDLSLVELSSEDLSLVVEVSSEDLSLVVDVPWVVLLLVDEVVSVDLSLVELSSSVVVLVDDTSDEVSSSLDPPRLLLLLLLLLSDELSLELSFDSVVDLRLVDENELGVKVAPDGET